MTKKISHFLILTILSVVISACGVAHDDQNEGAQVQTNQDQPGNMNVGLKRDNGDITKDKNTVGRRNNQNNQGKNEDDISASFTTINSQNYPHTSPILIQDAKYSFAELDARQIAELQREIEQQLSEQFGQLTPQLRQQAQQQAEQLAQQLQQQTQQQQAQQPQQQQQAQQPQQQQQAQQPQQRQQAQQPQQQQQAGQPQQQKQAQQPQQEQKAQPKQTEQQQQAAGGIGQYAQQVIDLTNQERAKEGLPALKADSQLSSVAQKKSQDMQANNYFSHTSPTYGSPFDMMRDFGVTYKTAGENIAQGQRTPAEVVQAWMNSEGHRKNIMSKDFTHIGVGYESSGNHWTQMFVGR